jgi:hypothetical protein
MLRFCCLIAGIALLAGGALMARQELALADARDVARKARHARTAPPEPRLREAFGAFDAANAGGSTDQLDLAINLHELGSTGGRESGIVRHARVYRSAEKLAKSSPLDARAWCVLALAQSKAIGLTPAVIAQLRACYALGSREIGLIDGRLMFAWDVWDELPQDVRNEAMIDVAATLSDTVLAPWMADRLAYAVAVVDPSRRVLAETLLSTYGEQLRNKYQQSIDRYRRLAAARSALR